MYIMWCNVVHKTTNCVITRQDGQSHNNNNEDNVHNYNTDMIIVSVYILISSIKYLSIFLLLFSVAAVMLL
jgi:hypothetical protein